VWTHRIRYRKFGNRQLFITVLLASVMMISKVRAGSSGLGEFLELTLCHIVRLLWNLAGEGCSSRRGVLVYLHTAISTRENIETPGTKNAGLAVPWFTHFCGQGWRRTSKVWKLGYRTRKGKDPNKKVRVVIEVGEMDSEAQWCLWEKGEEIENDGCGDWWAM
jgi:hypothetical protein